MLSDNNASAHAFSDKCSGQILEIHSCTFQGKAARSYYGRTNDGYGFAPQRAHASPELPVRGTKETHTSRGCSTQSTGRARAALAKVGIVSKRRICTLSSHIAFASFA